MAKKCPPGSFWNPATKQCQKAGATKDKPKKPRKDVAPGLPGKQVKNPAGKGKGNPPGACPTGYVWDTATKTCVKRKGTTTKPKDNCPPGYKWDGFRERCVRDKSAPTAKTCPPGSHWAEDVQRCVSGNPAAVECEPGKVWDDAKGRCVKTAETRHGCPEGSFYDADLDVCVEGTKPEEEPPVNCPAGTVWNGYMCVMDTAAEEEEVPPDAPPKPALPPELEDEGWDYVWDGEQWTLSRSTTAEDEAEKGTLRAQLRGWINDNFPEELANQAYAWVESIITEGRPGGYDQIILELQQQQFFRDAYPELGMRQLRGLGNVPLSYIRQYRQDAKNMAQRTFGRSITDHQIALLIGNNISIEEFQHRLGVYKRMETMAGPVRAFFEQIVGYNLSDEDLYEWFDPDINTEELTKAYDDARLRGMPVLFGLKPRTQAEADALHILMTGTGVSVDEVISRFQQVGEQAPLFERLGAIEGNILEGLPGDWGDFYKDIPNQLLVQADVFQNPYARALKQQMVMNELARFRQGGGAASTEGGQQIGLLSEAERASYG